MGLDYGTSTSWSAADVGRAFGDTMDWVQGLAVHAGQAAPITSFAVLEAWNQDASNAAFQGRFVSF